MSDKPAETGVPPLRIVAASAEDYCRSILATRPAETFWFQTGTAPYRGFSRPFRDRDGRWWWRPKPQFAWPIDFFTPLDRPPRLPICGARLGCQYPAPPEQADSRVHFNVIVDLAGYDIDRVASQKRRAIRKGLKGHDFVSLDPRDDATTEEARVVWNSHVARTGWNTAFDAAQFARYWRPLADHAGTNVLGVRDKEHGALCAWLVARVVAGCVFIDTIASHSDRLENRPNDAIIFAALWQAARTAGARHANYFLRSGLETLEHFKQSLGFDSSGLPSKLALNPLVAALLRRYRPHLWQRLVGDPPPPHAP